MQTPETGTTEAPFGRVLSAMITPFTPDGGLDLDGAQKLADHLVSSGHDGLVLNGTTGESPTTSDAEKAQLVRAVVEAVGDRAIVVAGAGSNETRHSVELAKQAAAAGAHGLLLVTPYYNRPPQAGLLAHFTAVADATELPMMLYDIPARTGREIERDTLLRLAEHPRIVANKDAKGNLPEASDVMARTDLAYYSGDDSLNFALLALGGVGIVSVVAHIVGPQLRAMVDAFVAGDVQAAREIDRSLLPVYEGIFRTQGAILTKAALTQLGLPAGPTRLPLVDATEAELAQLILDLADGGVPGFALPGA